MKSIKNICTSIVLLCISQRWPSFEKAQVVTDPNGSALSVAFVTQQKKLQLFSGQGVQCLNSDTSVSQPDTSE